MRSFLSCVVLLLCSPAYSIQLLYSVVPSTCGQCNGRITASGSGGVGAYTYLWMPAPPAGQGAPMATDLCPGSYILEVTDSDGNTASATIVVDAIAGLNVAGALAASTVNAACPGQCTGALMLNENTLGGAAPYTFSTLPAMPLNAICGDTPFDLTVMDSNGCTGTITTVVPERTIPSLLYTEVNGPCGGTPTSVVAYFDDPPLGATLMGPTGAPAPLTYINGGLGMVGAAMPGVYAITEPSFAPCSNNTWYIIYPGIVSECATVNGDVFVDVNGDCTNNSGDFGLADRTVNIAPGYTTITNALGHYQRQLPDGTYDLTVSNPNYTQDCPVASPVNFTVDELTPATVDIAFMPGPDPEVSVSCAFGEASVGFQQDLWITAINNSGVESGPVTITLDHDPLLAYCFIWYCIAPPYFPAPALPYPTAYAPGQITWQLDEGLAPGETRLLSSRLCVPADVSLLGAALQYDVNATTLLTDADLSNNACSHTSTVVGSYDPNDKQARTTSGSSSEWSLANDSLITYTIRFQNTGTAPAVNVVLVDTIQPTLDLRTLKILGGSHTYSAALNDRVLSFSFDHIMLPDSNANEPGSHGFAQFSIRPMTMAEGSSVENFADIYFDFNPAIRTNTSIVTAPLPTGIQQIPLSALTVTPNPVTEQLRVAVMGTTSLSILSTDGRVVMQGVTNDGSINVGELAVGTYVLRASGPNGTVNYGRFVKQ